MSQVNYEVVIPDCYLWMTEGYPDREKLFKQYVEGYIKNNFSHLEFKKIVGMKAICKKK
ncbi:hypothetical protein ACNRWW_14195 [Metabacillus sp. HB246100]